MKHSLQKTEIKKYVRAKKVLRLINSQLEQLEIENINKIKEIYKSSQVPLLDLYVTNPTTSTDIINSEKNRINKEICDSIMEKNLKQEQLKLSVKYTKKDDKLILHLYEIAISDK